MALIHNITFIPLFILLNLFNIHKNNYILSLITLISTIIISTQTKVFYTLLELFPTIKRDCFTLKIKSFFYSFSQLQSHTKIFVYLISKIIFTKKQIISFYINIYFITSYFSHNPYSINFIHIVKSNTHIIKNVTNCLKNVI